MRVVLIGGPADGRRIDLDGQARSLRIPMMEAVPTLWEASDVSMKSTMREDTYVIQRLSNDIWVGLHDSINPRDFIGRLAAGYRAELG